MYPVKIIIEGNYWDIQLYRGRLYLWDVNGTLSIYQWNELIDSLNPTNNSAFAYSFIDGNALYDNKFSPLLHDQNFIDFFENSFNAINSDIIISEEQLNKFLISKQNNPFSELPIDSDIYYNQLFAALDSGLYYINVHKNTKKYKADTKSKKLWDNPIISLKISYNGRTALSAGDEGLFEYRKQNTKYTEILYDNLEISDRNFYRISNQHSLFSDWNFSSIYNSSDIDNSFLAIYNTNKMTSDLYNETNPSSSYLGDENYEYYSFKNIIKFERIINDSIIFNLENNQFDNKLSWGNGDKIYKATDTGIDVVHFKQYNVKNLLNKDLLDLTDEEKIISDLHHIDFHPWKGKIIAGNVANFGTIVECENALVVLFDSRINNYDSITIQGPITKWRIYPRSLNYKNQLHVVLSDKIEIYSFNNDYFQDQNSKKLGIKYTHFNYHKNS